MRRKLTGGLIGVAAGVAISVAGAGGVRASQGLSPSRGAGAAGWLAGPTSASGTQVWAARYNGPGNGYDTAASVAVRNLSTCMRHGWPVFSELGPLAGRVG